MGARNQTSLSGRTDFACWHQNGSTRRRQLLPPDDGKRKPTADHKKPRSENGAQDQGLQISRVLCIVAARTGAGIRRLRQSRTSTADSKKEEVLRNRLVECV